MALERLPALQKPAAAEPPEPVPDVVADNRRRRGNHDHLDNVHVAPRREDAGGDQCGLARKWDSGRLHRDQHEEDDQPVVLDERLHRFSLGFAC